MEKKLQLHKSNAKAERDVKYRLAESKFHRKNERDRLIHERRQLNSNSDELKPLNDTYTVPEQEKGMNRRKLLELWRKERDQKLLSEKMKQRPVFKVFHVDHKDNLISKQPCLCQSLHASRVNLASISTVTTSNNTMPSIRNGPLTRSLTRKINQTADSIKSFKTNTIKTFSEIANAASKFTFSAVLVKKQPSQTKKNVKSNSNSIMSQKLTNNQTTVTTSNAIETTTLPDTDDIIVCSSKLPTSNSSNSIASMQYEDFCGELFIKNGNDDQNENDKVEFASMENIDTAVEMSKTTGKSKSKRWSYRKSRSGMYKIDIQSSILELDDHHMCNYDNNNPSVVVEVNETPLVKTDTLSKVEAAVSNDKIIETTTPLVEVAIASTVEVTVSPKEIINIPLIEVVESNNDIAISPTTTTEDIHAPTPIKESNNLEKEMEKLDLNSDYYEINGEKRNVKYYRNLVDHETKLLNELSVKWDAVINDAPEDVQGDIRSAIGLAKLLIDERFAQFIELIDQCEFKTGDKIVTCSDLQGFWDMVEFQVIDVKKKFDTLDKLRANNYVEDVVIPVVKKRVVKLPAKEKKAASTETKKPVKSKFAEFKAQMMKSKSQSVDIECQINDKENVGLNAIVDEVVLTSKTPLKLIENTIEKQQLNNNSTSKLNTKTRSRVSDLIKFDDTPKNKKKVSIKPCITHDEVNECVNNDDDDDDFLNLDTYKPISWRNSITIKATTNLISLTPTVTQTTPKTPRNNRRSILTATQTASGGTEVAQSPLLKLAYISSHGKRLSRSSQLYYD